MTAVPRVGYAKYKKALPVMNDTTVRTVSSAVPRNKSVEMRSPRMSRRTNATYDQARAAIRAPRKPDSEEQQVEESQWDDDSFEHHGHRMTQYLPWGRQVEVLLRGIPARFISSASVTRTDGDGPELSLASSSSSPHRGDTILRPKWPDRHMRGQTVPHVTNEDQIGRTLLVCSPFGPCSDSKDTFCPSRSPR